jgi:hypothetical protein
MRMAGGGEHASARDACHAIGYDSAVDPRLEDYGDDLAGGANVMLSPEVLAIYESQIAPLSVRDQLQLASEILGRLVDAGPCEEESPADVIARQQEALSKFRGAFSCDDTQASVRHDEILYGPAES